MLTSKKVTSETFNSGIINVLDASDGVITNTRIENIHYGERTFGIKRFFDAQVAGSTVEKLISVPLNDFIKRVDIIEMKDFRTGQTALYEIVMLQHKYDTAPASTYLTLKKTEINYVDQRNR